MSPFIHARQLKVLYIKITTQKYNKTKMLKLILKERGSQCKDVKMGMPALFYLFRVQTLACACDTSLSLFPDFISNPVKRALK